MTAPHIHKYRQVRWGKNGTIIYRCMLPDCSHYLHREMVKGKSTVCWTCGGTTLMDDENLRRIKPRCFGACGVVDPMVPDRVTDTTLPRQLESVAEIATRLTDMLKR